MIIEYFPQYDPEWWEARIGRPTASNFDKLISSTGKKSTQWKTYAYKKAAEIDTGKIEDTFKSKDMERGTLLEPLARQEYEFITGIEVEEVGIVYPDEKKIWSCSPDGLSLPKKKGLEIKCPKASTHKEYQHKNVLPTKYKHQVFGSLWICDAIESWDFMSFHPDMKPFITTVDRSDKEYITYVQALSAFLPEVISFINSIT